jgi:hypothetical protein
MFPEINSGGTTTGLMATSTWRQRSRFAAEVLARFRPGTEACLLRTRSCPGSAMQPGQRVTIRAKSSPGSAATHGADAARFDSSGSMRTSAAWASGGAFWSWRRGRHDAGIVFKWFSPRTASMHPGFIADSGSRSSRAFPTILVGISIYEGCCGEISATVGIIRNQALADTGAAAGERRARSEPIWNDSVLPLVAERQHVRLQSRH